jgi:hypothetical protein
MPTLTAGQLTTLRTHILANTNLIPAGFPWSGGFVGLAVNAVPNNSDGNVAVAGWYNLTATAGDSQPFADSLNLWKPSVTITEANTAINWSQNPAGATAADQTNSWLRWQSMYWSNVLDFTDNQVRSGVAAVWGSASASNTALKAVGVGRRAGTRFELLYAGANRGPNGNAADVDMTLNGRVSAFFGQLLTASNVETARNG